MATGACGIDCSVCRLHVSGICSTCGAGNSDTGKEKLAAQHRLFGTGCPVLACAVEKGLSYCLRDCDEFPCEKLTDSLYPFSAEYLAMQERRREHIEARPVASWPEATSQFWNALAAKDPQLVCSNTGATLLEDGKYLVQCLSESWLVDANQQQVMKADGAFGGEWDRQVPFLILVYLVMAQEEPASGTMIAPRDVLPGKDFFAGRYELKTHDLKRAFADKGEYFLQAGEKLGGTLRHEADVSARFRVFPKIIVDYLLWLEDEEFPASITILIDKNVPIHYPLDATAVLINLLSQRLIFVQEHFCHDKE